MGRLCGILDNAAVDEIIEEGLDVFLQDVRRRIVELVDQITGAYLQDEGPPARGEVARATVLLQHQQEQQQQSNGAVSGTNSRGRNWVTAIKR